MKAWFKHQQHDSGIDTVAVELPVALIHEDGSVVAYTPALDLSTCGKTEKEARKMFNEAVQIFFDDLIDNGNLPEVLTSLGWRFKKQQKQWVPPKVSQESMAVNVPAMA